MEVVHNILEGKYYSYFTAGETEIEQLRDLSKATAYVNAKIACLFLRISGCASS